ncbi:MAG: AAC(3) family N-acetyltransferase [Chromatiales bacterium]|nr:AAC(3) family N-acetyltransferase [Chromatiales bacterium]
MEYGYARQTRQKTQSWLLNWPLYPAGTESANHPARLAAMFYRWRKALRKQINKTFYPIDADAFLAALQQLGASAGDAICVHSEINALGHLRGGPAMLVDVLKRTVTPSGAVLMPSYPTGGSSLKYCQSGEIFDVRNTPSKVGLLTEVFRRSDGTRRSWHATNSMAGWGDRADHFLSDHYLSPTPFGRATPYGRLAGADDAYILMLGVPILSLLHHLQERVDFPNLFLPETHNVRFVDEQGRTHQMQSRFILPRIPYYVAVPGKHEDSPDWALLHDFALVFPHDRERQLLKAGVPLRGLSQDHPAPPCA